CVGEAEAGAGFRWLLERALAMRRDAATQTEDVSPTRLEAESPVLEKDGEFWRIGYAGTTVLLRHSRGLALLAHLVRCPDRDIHVRALASITPSGGCAVPRAAHAPRTGAPPLPGDARA